MSTDPSDRLDELIAAGLVEPPVRPQPAPERTERLVSPENLAAALAWDRDDTIDDVDVDDVDEDRPRPRHDR